MWETKKLGDVCETGAGGTPLKSKKEYYDSGTIPWLLSGEVSQRDIRRAKCFISDAGLKNSSAKLFPVNTVLVAMYGATAGQVGILRFEACTNQAVCGILPNQQTIPEFIYYTFLLKKNELVATASGNAQPNISQTKIKNTLIPLPPLPEQRRIVGILDEAFAGIDKIIANTEQNLSNARELFESYLNNAFTQKADGWAEKKLGDLLSIQNGYAFNSKQFSPEGDLALIRIRDLKRGYDTETRYSGEYDEKYIVRAGDYLIGMDGEFTCYEWKGEDALLNQRVCRLEHFSDSLDARFLFYGINKYLKAIEDVTAYTTVKHLSAKQITEISLPLPPLSEQKQMVDQLDQLSSATQRLEAIYQQKLDALNELKQSILHKAFSGELVKGEEKAAS